MRDMIKWPDSLLLPVYLGRLSIFQFSLSHEYTRVKKIKKNFITRRLEDLFSAASVHAKSSWSSWNWKQIFSLPLSCRTSRRSSADWSKKKLIKNSSRRIRGGALAWVVYGMVDRKSKTNKQLQCQSRMCERDDRCRADMNKWINRLWSYRLITCERWRRRREAFNLSRVLVY